MTKLQMIGAVLKWIIIVIYWLIIYFVVVSPLLRLLGEDHVRHRAPWLFLGCVVSLGLVLFSLINKKYSNLRESVMQLTVFLTFWYPLLML